jgi:hypothetical protein
MLRVTCAIIFLFCLPVFTCQAKSTISNFDHLSDRDAAVCFVDFRIDLVIGKTEAGIGKKKYCRYSIDRHVFLSLIKPVPVSTFYMNNNIRAKVCLSSNEIYFIDYNGIVKHGRERFEIDKKIFTNALRKLHSKPLEAGR